MKTPKASSFLTLYAYDLDLKPYPDSLPVLVYGIDNNIIAGKVKNYLLEYLGADTEISFSYGEDDIEITLKDLDKQSKYGETAGVFVPEQNGFDKQRYCFGDLLRIISRLTADDGCPWDKEQTHESIRINLIEEAYEAVDAVDSGDAAALIEELGDVMLQSVLHADIGLRNGEFSTGDVISALCRKLYSRHTHIFGDNKAQDAEAALGFWEGAKAKEKRYDNLKEQLQKYPQNFAAALKAEKIFKKLSKGLPKNTGGDSLLKLFEESLKTVSCKNPSAASFGEFLFLAVGLTALSGFDAEVELNKYCRRVIDKSDGADIFKIIRELRENR